jgi:hypothetical protein
VPAQSYKLLLIFKALEKKLLKKHLMIVIFNCAVLPLWPLVLKAETSEALGRFRFSEFSLQPRLRLEEPGQGGFEVRQTWLGFEWVKDESIRGSIWLGSSDLTTPAVWFTPKERPDFGIDEAFLEGKNFYADVRAGLINVNQGFEGFYPEWSWIMPESRVRRSGWLVKRDFGLQFRWMTQPFTSILSIHNGESGPNSDGKLWYSGAWQWKNNQGVGTLLTASVGNTRAEATTGASAKSTAVLSQNRFIFDGSQDAKIRYGTWALFREDERTLFLVEAGRGEIVQNGEKSPYAWGRLDISWNLGGDLSLLARYEQWQANTKDLESLSKSGSLGFSVTSLDRLQSVSIWATHNTENPSINNDEYFIVLRLNSRYLN